MSEYIVPEELVRRLEKGCSLTYKEIRHLLPDHRGETDRRVAVVEWAAALSRSMADAGKPCTIITAGGSHHVVLLTDAEAAEHNRERFAGYIRRARRRHRHALDVDATNLDAEQKRLHERAIGIQAAKLSALDSARSPVPVLVNQRSTPAIKIHTNRSDI